MKTREKIESTKNEVGIIIGRFQTPKLYESYQKALRHVISRHSKVSVILECSTIGSTRRNPLDFLTRKIMIEESYGDLINTILPIKDLEDDLVWSKQIDKSLREIYPTETIVLYGSYESFIKHYCGDFYTFNLEIDEEASSIEEKESTEIVRDNKFRQGVFNSSYNSYPVVFSTIDIAIVSEDYKKVLLAKKPNEEHFRFPGGFVDIDDENLIQTVKRETLEETGLEVKDIQYITSLQVDDWRYRNEIDRKIMTHFHIAKRLQGIPMPLDDLAEGELREFEIFNIKDTDVMKVHLPLLKELQEYIENVQRN